MKNATFILAIIAAGLAIINLIWPSAPLLTVAVLLVSVAAAVESSGATH